jgi:hypothetical protein
MSSQISKQEFTIVMGKSTRSGITGQKKEDAVMQVTGQGCRYESPFQVVSTEHTGKFIRNSLLSFRETHWLVYLKLTT